MATTATKRKPAPAKAVQPKAGNIDRFLALPDAEKAAVAARYERGVPESEWSPLTPAQRRRWERAVAGQRSNRAAADRSLVSIRVPIDGTLLKAADAHARARGMSRDELIALGLRMVIAGKAGPTVAD